MRCSRASCPSAWRSASLPRCGDLSTERPVDCRRTRTGEYRWCAPPASPPTTTALLHRPPTPPSYAPRAEAEGGRTCLPQWARVRRVAASGCWLTACWLTAWRLSVPARAGCYVPQQAGGCGRPSLQAGGEADLEAVLVPAGAATTERQPARTVASSRTGRRTRHRRTHSSRTDAAGRIRATCTAASGPATGNRSATTLPARGSLLCLCIAET